MIGLPSDTRTAIALRSLALGRDVRALPVSYTNHLKAQQLAASRFKDKTPSHYEEDHLIPLELGGN